MYSVAAVHCVIQNWGEIENRQDELERNTGGHGSQQSSARIRISDATDYHAGSADDVRSGKPDGV